MLVPKDEHEHQIDTNLRLLGAMLHRVRSVFGLTRVDIQDVLERFEDTDFARYTLNRVVERLEAGLAAIDQNASALYEGDSAKDADSSRAEASLTHPMRARLSASRPTRAIVVEDDREWQALIQRVLQSSGFTVDVASDIATASYLLRQDKHELALLDIRLTDDRDPQDFAGLELVQVVREHSPNAYVVVLTGYRSFHAAKEAVDLGVDAFLDKGDFDGESLQRVLDQIAVRREIERESVRQIQLNKYVYEILAIFSHEMRAPLVTIQRCAEALSSGAYGELTQEQVEAVQSIKDATKRESVLLEAHLDLNRIEKDAERLDCQEHDLVLLVRDEVAAHMSQADSKEVKIRTHLGKKKAIVRLDVSRFRVALNPLMDNAIKFSPQNGEIFVSAHLTENYVEVQISDQGPGIKSDELDKLLNLKATDSTAFSQRMRGSGLGLSMAKRMIELHNGRLWIESDGESGTTVSFRLPLKK